MGIVLEKTLTIDYALGTYVEIVCSNLTLVNNISIINVPPAGTPAELTLFIRASTTGTAGLNFPTQTVRLGDYDVSNTYPNVLIPDTNTTEIYKMYSNDGGATWYVILEHPALTINPTTFYAGFSSYPVVGLSGPTVNIDASASNVFRISVPNGATTINNPSGVLPGQVLTLILSNNSSGGSGTVTFGSAWKFPGGTFTLTPVLFAIDTITAVANSSGSTLYVTSITQNLL